ncbi:hypothetical protein F652_3484 [Enterobacteriaceae bacterium bta3-1]|nr:hypothetical protein F652_3484 [Enterobacteriaceae bacterium bta3-1]
MKLAHSIGSMRSAVGNGDKHVCLSPMFLPVLSAKATFDS